MGGSADSPLSEAMNGLWAKFLPQIEERVSTLQSAAVSLASGSLSPEDQQHASAEAHKLAGVLGTFGLQQGTELAREAESLYGGNLSANSAAFGRLAQIAEQLNAIVASRK
jgi:HPt (histidine-containing phosphotransfer) domain-containing protein